MILIYFQACFISICLYLDACIRCLKSSSQVGPNIENELEKGPNKVKMKGSGLPPVRDRIERYCSTRGDPPRSYFDNLNRSICRIRRVLYICKKNHIDRISIAISPDQFLVNHKFIHRLFFFIYKIDLIT